MRYSKNMRRKCQKFDMISSHKMPEGEELVYAGFLSDQNPNFILMMSNSPRENSSYLSLGKLSPMNIVDDEHSESILKVKLSNKLYENPVTDSLLKQYEGQLNMQLNLTPSTL